MDSRVNGARFWTVVASLFFLSYAVLSFEVALTRIFSVMLANHFVFAVVSGALFGLGVGAMALKRWGTRLSSSAVGTSSVLFAALIAASVLAIIEMPAFGENTFWLYLILAILPFTAAGFAIAGIFQEFASRGPMLYGADLLGAALGALTVVPLLDAVGGVNAVFFAAVAASVGALLLGWSRKRFPVFASSAFVALAAAFELLVGLGLQITVPITNDPDKDMYRILADPGFRGKVVESRWSSFGRTDLVKSDLIPGEMTLFVDGAAGSAMYKSSVLKDPKERAHLTLHYGEFFPFLFLKDDQKNNALIIGPGGGRDVVVALLGGVKAITAVEVNPDVVRIVKDYKDWNGGLYSGGNPRVTAVVAEGRNFVRTTRSTYDIIMLAIPVTKSSRSIEGYATTENYLFTVDAFGDYLSHLTPNGRIIIVAHNPVEIYRLIEMAAAAFERQGISEQDAMKRMYTVAGDMMPALVIQKQPLTPEEADAIHGGMHQAGFDQGAFYVPYQKQGVIPVKARLGTDAPQRMFDPFLLAVEDGRVSLSTLARAARPDIRPVTDDSPFFYKFERRLPSPFGVFSFLFVVGLVWLVALLLVRRRAVSRPGSLTGALRERPIMKRFLLLFAALGVGYMLVEISLFQKLMLFIGQPQRALTVLLFSLLLGGGLGSLLSGAVRVRTARTVTFVSLAVALAIVLVSAFFTQLFSLGIPPRTTSVALLVPLGILMGFPFPSAIRLTDAYGLGRHVSAMWGVNGIASVLGSALSMIVGISIGFSWALFLGAALYGLAALLFLGMPMRATPGEA